MRKRPDALRPSAICTSGVALGLTLATSVVSAQIEVESVRIVPTVSAQVTYTDNVNLQSDADKQSAFVLELVPGVNVSVRRPRARLQGSIRAPFVYETGGRDSSKIVPQVNLSGRLEAVDDFFFIEGAASVSQQYFSPFGARSPSLANDPDNRYTSQSYRLSPVITGELRPAVRYELRNDNLWTIASDAPGSTSNAYNNRLTARLDREATPFGWRAEYLREQLEFRSESTQVSQVARLSAVWRPDAQLELSLIAGYEDLKIPGDNPNGVIYGVSARWRPTPRTSVDANWQDRAFGSSYGVAIAHRTPLSVWSLDASRGITNFPQQLAQFPVGSSVPALLDQLFLSRVPDAAERELAVIRFMQEQGLGIVLSEPFALFAVQYRFVEQVRATVGLLGVRNSVFVTAYRVRTSPITRTIDAPIDLAAVEGNTQTGGGATWTTRLSSITTFSLSGDVVRSESQARAGLHTDQGFIRANLTTSLSARTSAFAGVRLQKLRSDVRPDARETAVFAGVSHTFR